MEARRTFTDKFLLFVKGVAMGAANKVPGVSGGMVAFVIGFYEEFIFSLRRFNVKAFKLLYYRGFKKFYAYVNGDFLSLILLGLVVSYFSVSLILDWLIKHFELYVWGLFFGMIIGSIYYICTEFKNWTKWNISIMVLGCIVGVAISFLEPATENDALWFVFLCGVISVSGMTLPGLSGSFLLILIGNYVLLLVDSVNAISLTVAEMVVGDFSFLENAKRIRLLKVMLMFLAGSVTGMVAFSHILGYIIKHHKSRIFALIIGFIAGSLGVVWPWKEKVFKTDTLGNILYDANQDPIIIQYQRYMPDLAKAETYVITAIILVGIFIVVGLERYGKKNTA